VIPLERRDRARALRRTAPIFEQEFWQQVRAARFSGFKFRRQQAIGPYIVDFACMTEKLVVELDGGQHQESLAYDARRDDWLRAEGYRVLRVWNSDWNANRQGVLEALWEMLHASGNRPSPQPLPPSGGGAFPALTDEHLSPHVNLLPSPVRGEGLGERAGSGQKSETSKALIPGGERA
jgi:very-short-patch-repair endonuclease